MKNRVCSLHNIRPELQVRADGDQGILLVTFTVGVQESSTRYSLQMAGSTSTESKFIKKEETRRDSQGQ
jgi:hypothetical protein